IHRFGSCGWTGIRLTRIALGNARQHGFLLVRGHDDPVPDLVDRAPAAETISSCFVQTADADAWARHGGVEQHPPSRFTTPLAQFPALAGTCHLPRLSDELAHIRKPAGDGCCRRHHRADEMGATAASLPT